MQGVDLPHKLISDSLTFLPHFNFIRFESVIIIPKTKDSQQNLQYFS